MIVKKKKFSLNNFKTSSGAVLPEVNVGWESYGRLNAQKSNVILVAHYFSSNSHAAGKYSEEDEFPGYWDSIIGPGKALDTDKYFIISSDSLVNASAYDPNVITTGPASINPETQKPYGLDFPVVTVQDFVNVQHALIKSLGVEKLYAVMGPSMGSHQALEWASSYPEMVPRVISVIGMGATSTYGVSQLENWISPIKQDPNWNNGNYYDQEKKPEAGLLNALKAIYLTAHHNDIFNEFVGDKMSHDQSPQKSITADFAVNKHISSSVRPHVAKVDANHLIYLARACQLYSVGHKKSLAEGLNSIQAKVLFLPSVNDQLLPPQAIKEVYELMKSNGKNVEYSEIKGPWGHLDGICSIEQKSNKISQFLASEEAL